MYQSPRTRRLGNDVAALERLRSESSVFRFSASGDPPQQYQVLFHGRGLCRERSKIKTRDHHRVEIKLGASYPRTMPELRWVTPIYHPNISEIGMVCLGGYGTHWVPSLQLDELCIMLWDMVRYHNYDIRSPYNREAALWVAGQTTFRFPTDSRPLRDLRASLGRIAASGDQASASTSSRTAVNRSPSRRTEADTNTPVARVRQFIERYGKVFGNGGGPVSEREGSDRARSRPELAYIQDFYIRRMSASSDARSGESTDLQPECRAPSNDMPASNGATEAAATNSAENNHGTGSGERDDVVLLEAVTDHPLPDAPRPQNDEIVFID
jgi:ubiquitin-protein ligase